MNEVVFVLVWESLTNAGFAYDVVKVYNCRDKAMSKIKELLSNIVPDFGDCYIRYDEYEVTVRSDNNSDFYHKFIIDKHEVIV